MRIAGPDFGRESRIALTAMALNVALILFGWRRYVDLQHEAELRADGERRAAVLAITDPASGLLNRKGFADRAEALRRTRGERGDNLVIVSVQMHRFKSVNDQHGYEMGERLLKGIAASLNEELGPEAVIARLSGDEFAIAFRFTRRAGRSRPDRRSGAARDHPAVPARRADDPGRRLCGNRRRLPQAKSASPICCAAPTSRWTAPRAGE